MRREELEELIRPLLQESGLELVQSSVARGGRMQNIRITLDHPDGVSVDACARISRRIAVMLDANPLLRGAYNLEVSSPGMNRPIWSAEHFRRFAGERVRVTMRPTAALPHFVIGLIGSEENGGFWIEPAPPEAEHGKGKRSGKERARTASQAPAEKNAEKNGDTPTGRRWVRLEEIDSAELNLDPWKRPAKSGA